MRAITIRKAADAIIDEARLAPGGTRHIQDHVDRVLEKLPVSQQDEVLSDIGSLTSIDGMGDGGASELYLKLAQFLALDGAVAEGGEAWPPKKRQ